jgi:hypothetical protein
MHTPLVETDLPGRSHRGKVRDVYDLGNELLIVATDRISALDVILPGGIPRKGEVLTRLSAWWFERIGRVVPNHFIALITEANADRVPLPLDDRYFGRSMLVRKARLSRGLRLEGVPADGPRVRHPPRGGVARIGGTRVADLHAIDQSGRRPRREHHL